MRISVQYPLANFYLIGSWHTGKRPMKGSLDVAIGLMESESDPPILNVFSGGMTFLQRRRILILTALVMIMILYAGATISQVGLVYWMTKPSEIFAKLGIPDNHFEQLRDNALRRSWTALAMTTARVVWIPVLFYFDVMARIWSGIQNTVPAWGLNRRSALFMAAWSITISATTLLSLPFRSVSFGLGSLALVRELLISISLKALQGLVFHQICKWRLPFIVFAVLFLFAYGRQKFSQELEYRTASGYPPMINVPPKLARIMETLDFPKDHLLVSPRQKDASHVQGSKDSVIVFNKILAERLNPGEITGVVLHELGHRHYNDVNVTVIFNMIRPFVGYALASFLVLPTPYYYAVFGFVSEPPIAAVTIGEFLAEALLALMKPLEMFVYRSLEYRADAFAKHYGSGLALARYLIFYADYATTWWFQIFIKRHPSATDRAVRLIS
jgi:Zn-dependent protease with chaperone function